MPTKTETRPHALVTGASSGLGAAFAERLAHDGYDLLIVARRADRLQSLADRLKREYGAGVEPVVADLSKSDGLRLVEKRVEQDKSLEMLINNAGFGGYMPFIQLEPDKAEELINLQVLAVVRLTRAALPGMLQRKQGVIINVSSRFGFSRAMGSDRLPKRATYAGTKAFVIAFSQLLESELQGTGVQVQALCPGVVETEFHERVGLVPNAYPATIVMKPEDVVQASLAALKLAEVICVPALEDTSLLAHIEEDERIMLEASRTGDLASRYK